MIHLFLDIPEVKVILPTPDHFYHWWEPISSICISLGFLLTGYSFLLSKNHKHTELFQKGQNIFGKA